MRHSGSSVVWWGGVAWLVLLAGASGWAGAGAVKEVEPNASWRSPQEVAATCEVAATLKDAMDHDFFGFKVEKPTFLRLAVTGIEDVDLQLILRGSDHRPLLVVNGQPAGKGEEAVHRLRRGVHSIEVLARVKRGQKVADAPYKLTLREVDLSKYEAPIERIKAAIKKGLAHLATQQHEEGWWPEQGIRHGLSGLALMGFVGEGLPEFNGVVGKGAAFFKKSYIAPGTFPQNAQMEARLTGSLVGKTSRHFIYEQAIAVLAMSEYVHHRKDPEARKMVAEGIRLLVQSQNTAAKPKVLGGPIDAENRFFGGWKYFPQNTSGDISASGWCIIALAAAETAGFKIPPNVRKDYVVFCTKCFNEKEGAYGYEPGGGKVTNTTNSIGVLTTLMCEGGESPVVRKGLRYIRNSLPCWEKEGGSGHYPFYYWYYASRAMYVAGGDYWKQWQGVVCPMLLDHQNDDGSWDTNEAEDKLGTNYSTAVAVLILQLCSGNPPAYLKGLELKVEQYPCPRCVDDVEDLLKRAARDRRTKEQLIKDIQALIERYRGE